MILFKAIGRTLLSILKWALMFALIIGGMILFGFMVTTPSIANIMGDILLGIIFILLIWVSAWAISLEVKDNYEKYTRKSTQTENSYRIYYNVVYKRDTFVSGKTKQQAISNLYTKIDEGKGDIDCSYKIIKVKEID